MTEAFDLDGVPEDQVDAYTVALFHSLKEAGTLAETLNAMSGDQRRMVQAALDRHGQRLGLGTAPEVALPGPAGDMAGVLVPAASSPAAEPDHGGVYFDDERYLDCSSPTRDGGLNIELGDSDTAAGDAFTRDEVRRIVEAILVRDAVTFDDGRYVDASMTQPDGTVMVELGDVDGNAANVGLAPDEVERVAASLLDTLGPDPEPKPQPIGKPVKVDSDDGAAVRVAHYPHGVDVELVHYDYADDDDDSAPRVMLDAAGAAGLAAAADAMADAEKQAAARYREMTERLQRLEARRLKLEEARFGERDAEYAIQLERQAEELLSRMDRRWATQRERLALLSDDDQARMRELDEEFYAARRASIQGATSGEQIAGYEAVKAARRAQRRIVYGMTDAELDEWDTGRISAERRAELRRRPGGLPDGDVGRRTLYDETQREWDAVSYDYQLVKVRYADLASRMRELSPDEAAELAAVTQSIADLETELGELCDQSEVATGEFPAGDGNTVVWQSVMCDGGTVRHSVDRRPPDAPDDWHVDYDGMEIPLLTTAQVRKIAKAVRPRPTPAPPVTPPQ